jgi:hypothetical protein
MMRRVLPIVLFACLLSLTATGAAAQAVSEGAIPKASVDKPAAKPKKAASADAHRTEKLAPKPAAQRTTGTPEAAATKHPAAPANESFHDCHSPESDA